MATSLVPDTHLEHLKSVTTLRSGKVITKTAYPNPAHIKAPKSLAVSFEKLEPFNSESVSVFEKRRKKPMPCQIHAPLMQRLRLPKKGTSNAKIYKLFEQVKINILLLDAIKQILAYAKFLKYLCIVKCTMQVQKK